MPTDQIQRLNYYQRQFLGAEDFKAQQAYHRDMRRRHHLGHHTFGIVVGLELVESPQAEDPSLLDVHVLPGMAVDGYGREILVLRPVRLDPADFASFKDVRLREVWIEYAEENIRSPAPGYELCNTPGQLSRTLETYRIVIHPAGASHPDVVVDGKAFAPPAPPPAPPPTPGALGIPIDESVPHQEFPEPETYWRIRLGNVKWDGIQRLFVPATQPELENGRQYLGLVSSSVLAPHHRLRIKDRSAFTDASQETDHLVGIEGTLRVDGDAHFRQDVGIGTLTPEQNLSVQGGLNIDQADANTGALSPGLSFGSLSGEGIASRRSAGGNGFGLDLYTASTARLSITNAGLVGIATIAPTHRLHVNDIRGIRQNRLYLTGGDGWSSLTYNASHNAANNDWEFPDPSHRAVTIEMDDFNGVPRFQVWSTRTGAETVWTQRLAIDGDTGTVLMAHHGGNVGIGTSAPALKLHVEGDLGRPNAACTLNLFGSRIGDIGGGVLFLRSGGDVVAFDGGDRIGIGTGAPTQQLTLASPQGSRLEITHTSASLPWIAMSGQVNAGSFVINQQSAGTPAPGADFALMRDGLKRVILGDVDTYLSSQNNGTLQFFINREAPGEIEAMKITGAADVGIGTPAPAARLHVRDDLNGSESSLNSHVAVIENLSPGSNADVLALKIGATAAPLTQSGNNFITFFAGNIVVGRIEGTNSGFPAFNPGVTLLSGAADFAECLPRKDPEETLEVGDIVGVHAGEVTRKTAGAHHVLVVTARPVVVGNAPVAELRHRFATVTFLGQVPVKVRGRVEAGDYIIPSGDDDGIGVAWSPTHRVSSHPHGIVGRAWESSDLPGVKTILTAVGLPGCDPKGVAPDAPAASADELALLRQELNKLKASLFP